MKNHDQQDPNQKPLESPERLETVAFHLTQLYQRLAQDRDHWAMTGDHLAEAVKIFDQQLQQLATLEERMKQQVTQSLATETQQAIDQLRDSFQQAIRTVLANTLKDTADDLVKMVQEAKHTLKAHQQDIANTRKWWIGLAFISAVSGGIISNVIIYLLSR